MFFAALFTIAKLWKQPKCPLIDKWIKKISLTHTHTHTHTHTRSGILFSHKLEKNLAICHNIDGSRKYKAKQVSQRQIPYDFTHMWNLRNKTNRKKRKKFKKQTL